MAQQNNIWNVVHWGIGFCLVFTSFGPCHNIVSEAFDQAEYDSLGQYSIGIIYLVFAICSLLWTPLVESLGPIKSMWLGSLCYFIWVSSGLLPVAFQKTPFIEALVWIIMTITGAINGFGASLLWIGQGKYISNWWTDENKGIYYGVWWLIYSSSSFTGNILGNTQYLTL